MNEFEKKTERALFLMSHMSHLVALYDRIVLFRYVSVIYFLFTFMLIFTLQSQINGQVFKKL